MKYCRICKNTKDESDFAKSKRAKDGLQTYCRVCLSSLNRGYRDGGAYRSKGLFGGNREIAIQRDREKCVKCGMTREEHRIKYNRDITVDHINGKGTNTPIEEKDNRLENLQTLCLNCHGIKDIYRSKLKPPKRLAQIDIEGNIVGVFDSQMDAERSKQPPGKKFRSRGIGRALKKNNKHKGYYWKLLEDTHA